MRLPVAVVVTLVVALTAGCTAFSADVPGGDAGLRVATAFYPLEYVVTRVAGDHAGVENLTVPGKEPHDLELTIKETALVAQADLVVVEHGFQPAVDDAVETSAEGVVLDAADAVDLLPGEEHGQDPHFWQ